MQRSCCCCPKTARARCIAKERFSNACFWQGLYMCSTNARQSHSALYISIKDSSKFAFSRSQKAKIFPASQGRRLKAGTAGPGIFDRVWPLALRSYVVGRVKVVHLFGISPPGPHNPQVFTVLGVDPIRVWVRSSSWLSIRPMHLREWGESNQNCRHVESIGYRVRLTRRAGV
jgi:hypothetical protein